MEEFQFQSAVLTSQFPELLGVALLDSESGLRSLYVSAQASASQLRQPTSMLRSINPDDIGIIWRERQAVFGPPVAPRPIIGTDLGAYTVLPTSLFSMASKLVQVMVAEFNIDSLLYFSLPRELVSRYAILMVDGSGNALAGQWSETPSRLRELLPWVSPPPTARVGLAPISDDLFVLVRGYRTSSDLLGTFLQWAVGGLSLLTLWMLVTNWRHARRRLRTQRALMDETFFRRAMEDSMLTGMRAMDMQGRITYVNPAFCRMTGWSEAELVGQHPPFSFWAEEDHAMLLERLASELKGIVNHSGLKCGSDGAAETPSMPGCTCHLWCLTQVIRLAGLASITDITEPKKTREELAAAHDVSPSCSKA